MLKPPHRTAAMCRKLAADEAIVHFLHADWDYSVRMSVLWCSIPAFMYSGDHAVGLELVSVLESWARDHDEPEIVNLLQRDKVIKILSRIPLECP